MKIGKTVSLFSICMSLSFSLGFSKEIGWVTDFQEGLKLGSEEEKCIVVDFYTDWCKWCKTLDTITYRDTAVIKFLSDLISIKVNAEKDTLATRNYMVHGYPSILFLNADGQEADRIVGYLPPNDFLKRAKEILEGTCTFSVLQTREKEHPKDIELLYKLGEKYAERGMWDEATTRYRKIIEIDPKNESSKSDSSKFNIGYTYLRGKQYGEERYYKAIDEFNGLITMFPKSKCVEDAQLYIGYSYEKAADTTKAITAYELFISDYPDSKNCNWAKTRIEKLTPKKIEQK